MSRLFRLIELTTKWLTRVVTQPAEELNRYQMAVRSAYDLGRFGARQLRHDRAQQMAAALSFRTLFGLLPVLVLMTVLVRASGMQQNFIDKLKRLLSLWGLDGIRIITPAAPGGESSTLSMWIIERVNDAERLNLTAIGWVGLAVTIYAALGLVVTIENCFNVIYRAPNGRKWSRRVPMYWFVLTISPLAIVLSAVVDNYFRGFTGTLSAQKWLSPIVGVFWNIVSMWLLLFAVYMLLPNTRVKLRPAAIGAFVSAILLELGKRTLGIYLQNALSISNLYGSLGLIPLFMFWVYLMWLAILFGLQVSSTLQHLRGRQTAELKQRRWETAMVDPAIVIAIMTQIATRFQNGKVAALEELAKTSGLPEHPMEKIIDRLVDAGMVHRIADAENSLTLSRPPDTISLRYLLELAFETVDESFDAEEFCPGIEELRQAQIDAAGDRTLHSLMQAGDAS